MGTNAFHLLEIRKSQLEIPKKTLTKVIISQRLCNKKVSNMKTEIIGVFVLNHIDVVQVFFAATQPLYPPAKLVTLYPLRFNAMHAAALRPPPRQWTTHSFSLFRSSSRSIKRVCAILHASGIFPRSYSGIRRTSRMSF